MWIFFTPEALDLIICCRYTLQSSNCIFLYVLPSNPAICVLLNRISLTLALTIHLNSMETLVQIASLKPLFCHVILSLVPWRLK